MLQFLRTAQLTVGQKVFRTRLQFAIEKFTNGVNPNNCSIAAFNLSQDSRNQIEAAPRNSLKLFLAAGYQGNNKLIFSGEVFYAHSDRKGPDIITSFKVNSGQVAVSQGHISIVGQVSDWQIFQALLTRFMLYGIVKGHVSANVQQELTRGTYARGYSASTTLSALMDHITKRHGFRWSIDNEAVNIYEKGVFEDQEQILLSKDTGLIGFPTKTDAGNYKIKALLNADINCGKKIKVVSKQMPIPAPVKANKVTHVGDTLEGDWYTEFEALDLSFNPSLSGVTP